MGDNASVRSARSRRTSQRSGTGSLGGASQGSGAGIPPVAKISRYDEVTKKPIPNLFAKEVMAALETRGGALWERLVKESHLRASDAGEANAEVSWSQAVKN